MTDQAMQELDQQTIEGFGRQWTTYTDSTGYYGSTDCLADILGSVYDMSRVQGARTADIGSGTGRIVNMLLDAGAVSVIAVEPSAAFDVLRRNTRDRAAQVELVHGTGEAIPAGRDLDLVVSMGVLHHIVDPSPVVRAALAALRPGGTFVVWLYGHEGNGLVLWLLGALRTVTPRLPHRMLARVAGLFEGFASAYAALCHRLPLPMRDYMRNHFAQLDRNQRRLTIYDQLNPSYAKYYRRDEARALLTTNGFADVELYHRHGYSWTVAGRKPA